MRAHTRGFLLTLLGVLVLTPDTLLVRLMDDDPWTVTACRGLLSGPAILALYLLLRGRRALGEVRALGAAGAAVALLNAVNAVAFIVALEHTSVASTLIILATSPLLAALLSFALLRERIAGATWAAIFTAFAGVAVVVSDGFERGTLLGDASAFVTAASLALAFVVIRRARAHNMVPAAAAGALLSGLVVLPFADLSGVAGAQLPYALTMGLVVLPVAFWLLTLGPRTVPAPEVALLLLLETVLGPLWVWLGVGERPGAAALVGGGIVVATLLAHALWRLGRGSRAAPPA